MSDYMVDQTTGALAARYKPVVVTIHWLTAALLIWQIWIGFTFHDMPKGPERMEMFALHKTVGASILIMGLVRLAVRLINPPPPYPDDMPKWERFFAVWNHRLFYVLIIALPLTGLAAVSGRAEDGMVPLLGGLSLPAIPGVPKDNEFGEVHEYLVFATLALLALHVAGALKHQFIDRDASANRMWPFGVRER